MSIVYASNNLKCEILFKEKIHNTITTLLTNRFNFEQTTDDIDETEDNEDEQKTSGAVPAWMRMLNQNAAQWLSLLPEKLTPLSRTADSIKDPMFRYFEREINIGVSLLKQVCVYFSFVCVCVPVCMVVMYPQV